MWVLARCGPDTVGDVVTGGRAAAVVGLGVVLVAGPGRSRAPGVHTAAVAFVDLVGEPVGDLVGVDPDVVVQILDRADHDLGVRVRAPGPDLFHADRGAGVLAAADLLVTQVHVDHHLPGFTSGPVPGSGFRSRPRWRRAITPSSIPHVQGLPLQARVAGRLASRCRARPGPGTRPPRRCRCGRRHRCAPRRASLRRPRPAGPLPGRGRRCPGLRGTAARSAPPRPGAPPAASRRSTCAAPAAGRVRVCWAIRPARHHTSSPPATRAHSSGSR